MHTVQRTSPIGQKSTKSSRKRLKKDLYAAREKNGIFLSAENYEGMESKIKSQREIIKELEDKITANLEEIKKVLEITVCR